MLKARQGTSSDTVRRCGSRAQRKEAGEEEEPEARVELGPEAQRLSEDAWRKTEELLNNQTSRKTVERCGHFANNLSVNLA